MDEILEKCFEKWARMIKPNANLSEAHIKKAMEDIFVSGDKDIINKITNLNIYDKVIDYMQLRKMIEGEI